MYLKEKHFNIPLCHRLNFASVFPLRKIDIFYKENMPKTCVCVEIYSSEISMGSPRLNIKKIHVNRSIKCFLFSRSLFTFLLFFKLVQLVYPICLPNTWHPVTFSGWIYFYFFFFYLFVYLFFFVCLKIPKIFPC